MKIPTADLTKPKLSGAWVIGAFVAGLILMAVFAAVSYVFNKGKSVAAQASQKVTGAAGNPAQFYLS